MVNRHNYEEFFLLYADDELTHQQRAAVELFVQQNPDMAAELEMIKQLKLEPEDGIVFPGRESLYKTTDVEINTANYEEFFLLYIDNELDEKAAAAVETFVLQHPQLQDEFTLLKQTVLQPEAITFADKSSLYRKEERKVGYLRFVNLAAAAAVIGLIVIGWWLYPKTKPEGSVINDPTVNPVVKSTAPAGKTPQNLVVSPEVQRASEKTTEVAATGTVGREQRAIVKVPAHSGVQVQQQPVIMAKNDKPIEETQPAPDKTPGTANTGTDNTAVAASGGGGLRNGVTARIVDTLPFGKDTHPDSGGGDGPTIATIDKAQGKGVNPIFSPTTVAYKEIDTHEDDRSVYVGALELNKDKVKGLFRWAGRLFGAKPKKDVD